MYNAYQKASHKETLADICNEETILCILNTTNLGELYEERKNI